MLVRGDVRGVGFDCGCDVLELFLINQNSRNVNLHTLRRLGIWNYVGRIFIFVIDDDDCRGTQSLSIKSLLGESTLSSLGQNYEWNARLVVSGCDLDVFTCVKWLSDFDSTDNSVSVWDISERCKSSVQSLKINMGLGVEYLLLPFCMLTSH